MSVVDASATSKNSLVPKKAILRLHSEIHESRYAMIFLDPSHLLSTYALFAIAELTISYAELEICYE